MPLAPGCPELARRQDPGDSPCILEEVPAHSDLGSWWTECDPPRLHVSNRCEQQRAAEVHDGACRSSLGQARGHRLGALACGIS